MVFLKSNLKSFNRHLRKSTKKYTTVCNNKATVMFVSPCSVYSSNEVREICGAVLIRAGHAGVKDRTTPVISRFLSLH